MEKIEDLHPGTKYHVKYMPTKHLYERDGILKSENKTSYVFTIPDDSGDFFNVQKKHLITAIKQ